MAFENQTSNRLTLDGQISWYGWPVLCIVPQVIEPFETVFFDRNYSGVYNAAASAYRYQIGTTGWYAYVAVYTCRFGSNAIFLKLSRDRNYSWESIYYNMTHKSATAPAVTTAPCQEGRGAAPSCARATSSSRHRGPPSQLRSSEPPQARGPT